MTRVPIAAVLLLAAMLATRLPLISGFFHLGDLSWAAFFLGGFYLRAHRKAFPVFLAAAVAIDLAVIAWTGIDNRCLTVAYWFIVPAYGVLWLAGAWLAGQEPRGATGALRAGAALLLSASLCFLLTNASFYWLGEHATPATWDGWVQNFTRWYWPFVRTTLVFAGLVLAAHLTARSERVVNRGPGAPSP